jgi:hypothetical protein
LLPLVQECPYKFNYGMRGKAVVGGSVREICRRHGHLTEVAEFLLTRDKFGLGMYCCKTLGTSANCELTYAFNAMLQVIAIRLEQRMGMADGPRRKRNRRRTVRWNDGMIVGVTLAEIHNGRSTSAYCHALEIAKTSDLLHPKWHSSLA